jgi:hypothetical protein
LECFRHENEDDAIFLEKAFIYEDIRHDELKNLIAFFEEHNDISSHLMHLFVDKLKEEKKIIQAETQEAVVDYKLGMMDPSREAAGIEKQQNIKKNVGKKLKYKNYK